MAVKDNTTRMHEDIKKEFNKLINIKAHGVQKFSNEFIYREVAHKFYKSPKTIENIIFNRTATVHVTPAQGELFTDLSQ